MIDIKNLSKSFEGVKVVNQISCSIGDGTVFGIVGSNGAGKSTLLRTMSGVYDAEEGSIIYDGTELNNKLENAPSILFLSDEMYYEPNDSINALAKRYKLFYKNFDDEKFARILDVFSLNKKTRIEKLSKGMKKQAVLSVALSCGAKYLFLDETLDGLDPIMRINAKKLIYEEISDKKVTVVITSHSLKELEDMCDSLAMLHEGKIVVKGDVDGLKGELVKVRCAFSQKVSQSDFKGIDILDFASSGKLCTIIVKGKDGEIEKKISGMKPIYLEVLPVSIEETFVVSLKIKGYGSHMDWRDE